MLGPFTNLKSPRFPPTSPVLYDKTTPYFGMCQIRFYYCQYGTTIVQLSLDVASVHSSPKTSIWSPSSHVSNKQSHCEWSRVVVELPEQKTEYYLQFSAKNFFSGASWAIDDFSMTPGCFLGAEAWRAHYIPEFYNITTCGQSGRHLPTQNICDVGYNYTAVRVKVNPSGRKGYQRWISPKAGEYRIEAFGAVGGSLPNVAANNNGGKVTLLVNLTAGESLDVLAGQMGESPCLINLEAIKPNLTADQYDAFTVVCDYAKQSKNDISLRDPLVVPGTGGGGATMVWRAAGTKQLLLVAAGGGGVFPSSILPQEYLNSADKSSTTLSQSGGRPYSPSGINLTNQAFWTYTTRTEGEQRIPIGGRGGSIESSSTERKDDASCQECGAMWGGSLSSDRASAGVCPSGSYWMTFGGFGGGGASCGPGAGGGAGYYGGESGKFASGEGGWSYAVSKEAEITSGVNRQNGYALIYPCRLNCPEDSICRFYLDDEKVYRTICQCANGQSVAEHESCFQPTTDTPPIPPTRSSDHYLALVIIVIILGFAFFIVFAYICYQQRFATGRNKYKYRQEHGIVMRHFPQSGSGNSQIEFNPNYEIAGSFADLRQIPRHCVTLIKALGQGAFGEVYEGHLSNLPGEPMTLSIAVKTLPDIATPQSQSDFEMEALIMSKFNHENIVRFIGVCFEKMPRLIVLELLAGGDLKTFLRESRPRWLGQGTVPPTPTLRMIDLVEMALDVAKGCNYLEENHFIHRDIAARNCLLTTKDSGRVVKIADFGMARDIYRADYYRKGGKAMLPVKWMPPEAFLDGIFTSKTDVWSYGVLLWEIFSMGYMPYPGRNNQEVMQLVTAGGRLEAPNGCPLQIYQLMTQCWSTLADERPHFSTIVERLGYCIQDPELSTAPLPQLMHKNSSSMEPPALLKTPHGMMSASFSSPDPMPTRGTGVAQAACPPYHPQSSEPFLPMSSDKPSTSSVSDMGGPQDALLSGFDPVVHMRGISSAAPIDQSGGDVAKRRSSAALAASLLAPGTNRLFDCDDDDVFATDTGATSSANNFSSPYNNLQQQQSQLL
uniref:Tyrosine-protein kinase receptor n=1 Tax=Plectus sambesii TaxID=2011161 RepID=A0A914VX86_9BILA